MNVDQIAKAKQRVTMEVPSTAGNYCATRITLGAPLSTGEREDSFQGITCLIEDVGTDGTNQAPVGMVAELWLSQVPDGSVSAANMTDANYFFSGQVVVPANVAYTPVGVTVSYGMGTWPLAGWPMVQIRVKSGGVGGPVTISASGI